MEQALEKRQSAEMLDLIEAEIEFWREFVRSNHRVGDLEMVIKGQRALTRVLRRRKAFLQQAPANVVQFLR